jgi:hypothetical protein
MRPPARPGAARQRSAVPLEFGSVRENRALHARQRRGRRVSGTCVDLHRTPPPRPITTTCSACWIPDDRAGDGRCSPRAHRPASPGRPPGEQESLRANGRGSTATRAITEGSRWGRADLRLQAPPFGNPKLIEKERSGRFGTSPLSIRRLHRVDVDRASQCFEAARSVSDPPSRSGARRRHRSEAGRSCGNLIVQPALPSSRTRQRSWVGGS